VLTKQESDITRDDLADLDDTDDAVCYPAFDQALDIYALSLIYHSRLKKTERSVHYLSVFQEMEAIHLRVGVVEQETTVN
jgi:hypothetical protein